MATNPTFWANGPYLHNLPIGRESNFTLGWAFGFENSPFSGQENSEVQELLSYFDDLIYNAEIVEKGFYQLFGVNSLEEWENKFLGEKVYDKSGNFTGVRVGTNLYNKTVIAITHPSIYSILSGESSDIQKYINRAHQLLQDMLTQTVLDSVNERLLKRPTIRKIGDLIAAQVGGLSGGRGAAAKTLSQAQKSNASIDDFLREITIQAAQEAHKEFQGSKQKISDKVTEELTEKIVEPKLLISQAVKQAKERLKQALTPVDFGFNEETSLTDGEFVKQKNKYIRKVGSILNRDFKGALKGNLTTTASGLLGEGATSVVLTMYTIVDVAELQRKAKSLEVYNAAYAESKRFRLDTMGQAPVDISVQGVTEDQQRILYNIQVKNTQAGPKDILQGVGIPGSSVSTISGFIADLEHRNIPGMKMLNKDLLKYQLANSLFMQAHDYRDDNFLEAFNNFLASTIEHYVKSYYAEGMTKNTKGYKSLGKRGSTVYENHFILRPTIGLFPISFFLKAARLAMSEQFESSKLFELGWTKTEESLQETKTQQALNQTAMRRGKFAQLSKTDLGKRDSGAYLYPDALITQGIKYGNIVLDKVSPPSISISGQLFRQQIQELWSRLNTF